MLHVNVVHMPMSPNYVRSLHNGVSLLDLVYIDPFLVASNIYILPTPMFPLLSISNPNLFISQPLNTGLL